MPRKFKLSTPRKYEWKKARVVYADDDSDDEMTVSIPLALIQAPSPLSLLHSRVKADVVLPQGTLANTMHVYILTHMTYRMV